MRETGVRHRTALEPDTSLNDTLLLDSDREGQPHRRGRGPRRTSPATRVKLVVAATMALLAVGYLVFSATQTSAVYYLTIPEMEAMGGDAMTRPVRVGGLVVPGTIQRDGATLRFRMVDAEPETPPEVALKSEKTLNVVYQGVVPDIFQDLVHVVVEGKLTPSGEFDARTLLAKCPSRFEAAPGDQPAAPDQRP